MKEYSWTITFILLILFILTIKYGVPHLAIWILPGFIIIQLILIFIYILINLYWTENIKNTKASIMELFLLFLKAYYYELRFKVIPFTVSCLLVIISIFVLNILAGIIFVITGIISFLLIDRYRRKKRAVYIPNMKEYEINKITEKYNIRALRCKIIQEKIRIILQRNFLFIKKETIHRETESEKERKHCPLCNSKEFVDFIVCAYGWEYVLCTQCKLVYLKNVLIEKDKLQNIYNKDYSCKYIDPESVSSGRWGANHYLQFAKPGKLLEIGCSVGSFLSRAREMGFEVEGCEIDAWAVEECKKQYLKVKSGAFEELEYEEEDFDYIVMTHVLEHFIDPLSALKKIFRILKKDGYLFNYMPDITQCTGKRWFHFKEACEHLNFFTIGTFVFLSSQTGYKILSTGRTTSMDFWVWLKKI